MGRWMLVRIWVSGSPVEAEGERVHDDGRQGEDRGQPGTRLDRESGRSHAKYAAMKGKREEADVEPVELAAVVEADAEERRELDRHARRDGQGEGDPHLPRPLGVARLVAPGPAVAGEDELLPETVRVLPGELPGQEVDGPHPLDRHQERFVFGEALRAEGSDLLRRWSSSSSASEPVIARLLRRWARHASICLLEIRPPRSRRGASGPWAQLRWGRGKRLPSLLAESARADQTFRSVSSMVRHCRRSSASCSRPASVTR